MARVTRVQLIENRSEIDTSRYHKIQSRKRKMNRDRKACTPDDTEITDCEVYLEYDSCDESNRHRPWHQTPRKPKNVVSQLLTPPSTGRGMSANNTSRACAISPLPYRPDLRRETRQPNHTKFIHRDKYGEIILPYYRDPLYNYRNRTLRAIAFRCWGPSRTVPSNDEEDIRVPNPVTGGLHGINTAHGFWSGAFNGTFTEPPNRNHAAFGRSVHIQLRPLAEPSPWISIWTSLIASLHRLITSKTSTYLSLIDLQYLGTHQWFLYPTIYPAGAVIDQYRLRDIPYELGKPYKYKGNPEWIVWEHIPPAAIISTRSRVEFERHLGRHPSLSDILLLPVLSKTETVREFRGLADKPKIPLNTETGNAIGAFLAFVGVPDRFLSKAASIAAQNWKFTIESSGCSTLDYFDGAQAGYQCEGEYLDPPEVTCPEENDPANGYTANGNSKMDNDEIVTINDNAGNYGTTGTHIDASNSFITERRTVTDHISVSEPSTNSDGTIEFTESFFQELYAAINPTRDLSSPSIAEHCPRSIPVNESEAQPKDKTKDAPDSSAYYQIQHAYYELIDLTSEDGQEMKDTPMCQNSRGDDEPMPMPTSSNIFDLSAFHSA